MSRGDRRIAAERLEAYLDDRLSAEEKADFERQLSADANATRQVELQRQIDHRLRQLFSPVDMPSGLIDQLLAADGPPERRSELPPQTRSRRFLLACFGALAATLACGLLAWQWLRQPRLEPYFRPRPLAALYREAVDAGFRPYYFCEDDERFRLTFAKRQKVPLRLADMPSDRRMIGLSYLGGLSRDTTAILCYSQEQPVVVFVDRRENDTPKAIEESDPALHVFREELGDLVLYEVTPLGSATIMDSLKTDATAP
jgi:hypothetical protein